MRAGIEITVTADDRRRPDPDRVLAAINRGKQAWESAHYACGAFTGFLVEPTSRSSAAAKHIKLVVGAQAGEVGQTVRHAKKSRDGRYVPNLVIAETVLAQHDAVSLLHRLRLLRNLHGKVEQDRKSTRLNSSHKCANRMPSSA